MTRRSVTFSARIRALLDLLDTQVSRLGTGVSTAILTVIASIGWVSLHFMIRTLEGQPVSGLSIVNISVEVSLILAPVIYYARDVIAKMKTSRAHLDEMSRRLAISVEQAENANRAKSAFLANMSHELRTPLNAIMGFSEVMKEEHLGPVQNVRYLGYAGDIHASGTYLLGIINDILDLSKIEAGKMSLDSATEFPLRQALDASLGMVTALGEKFGVRLVAELPPDSVRLVAVERMIRQILINLLGNAIKFTPAGGSVTLGGGHTEGGGYALTVKDSGIGMTEAEIAQALMPFGQVENKMTATHNGTGLGLPLAKAMVELHGGSLSVTSVPHHGTTILLTFPPGRVCAASARAAA